MPFFEVSAESLQPVPAISFAAARFRERDDLQRLLRLHLHKLVADVVVIAEEFCDWDESRHRIDLLGIDRKGNLVVIELKRGDTGNHMELQAVRYASMVSTMTFDQAVVAYQTFLDRASGGDARELLLSFLGWIEPSDNDFGQDVRIILFSEDYSRELTTSILWLNAKGLDITCFRMSAYSVDGRLLVNFQQIIPLAEAEAYQVKVRNKQLVEQTARRSRVPWNGEFYANYGDAEARCWADARKYGFISAGGGEWFTRTLNLLTPGSRVWVNRPGVGYLGVGLVTGKPCQANEFKVELPEGQVPYLEVGQISDAVRRHAADPESMELFVPIQWLATVDETKAVREPGFFGNQNSVAKPMAESWPTTVERLKAAFSIED
nr:hypothetical protein [Luteibacter rhizovicinus]